jgi:hypothetical protein
MGREATVCYLDTDRIHVDVDAAVEVHHDQPIQVAQVRPEVLILAPQLLV